MGLSGSAFINITIFAALNKRKTTKKAIMYLTAEIKKKMFKEHGGSEKNTGTSEGQIAIFTHRINFLTKHLQENPKDLSTKRSLVNLVGKRKSLLEYLKAKDIAAYRALIKKLEIRR